MSCKCFVLNAIFSCGPFECSHQLSSVDMRLDFCGLVPVGKALMFCASSYVFLNTLTLGCFFHQSPSQIVWL